MSIPRTKQPVEQRSRLYCVTNNLFVNVDSALWFLCCFCDLKELVYIKVEAAVY
jgi:hypothetical protein